MSDVKRALEFIKAHGPVSALALAEAMALSEKAARSAIDRLRALGEPIWFDPKLRVFWWRDDRPPTGERYKQWKREFQEP